MPAAERGFETCQLRSRHWVITSAATGEAEHVRGEGVIGKYPLLTERNYRDDEDRGRRQVERGMRVCVSVSVCMCVCVCMCACVCVCVCMHVSWSLLIYISNECGPICLGSDAAYPFTYQSCSGRVGQGQGGTFGGELIFVPGSINQPSGPDFNVTVATFPLSPATGSFVF
jgi:hypothetical protein